MKQKVWIVGVLLALVIAARLLEIWPAPKRTQESNGPSFNVGSTESRNNLSTTSSSASSSDATFSARRILFINESRAPLARRVAGLVVRGLKALPQVEEVTMAGPDTVPTEGERAPDLFVCLDLRDLSESGVVTHTLKATLTASLGTEPWKSSHYSRGPTSPPGVDLGWSATLEHKTDFTGVRSDRYTAAAASIAGELFKGMSNQIAELSEKFTPLPSLPAEFYGPYQPVADFDFLKTIDARRVGSYQGLFMHNDTYWRFQTDTNPVPRLQWIVGQLEAAQWRSHSVWLTNTADPSAQFAREGATLEIFADRRGLPMVNDREGRPLDFIIHYRRRFTSKECEAAVDKLFSSSVSVEALLPFENAFSRAQRDRFYEVVEKTPTRSPRAYLRLADLYLDRHQTNVVVEMLSRANALAATMRDPSELESGIDSLAHRISPKKTLSFAITPEVCRALGFLDITNVTDAMDVERDFGQPLVLFGTGARGWQLVSLTLDPPQREECPWHLVQSEDGSRGVSSSHLTLSKDARWEQTVGFGDRRAVVTAVPLPEAKRVRYTVKPGT